MGRSVLRFGMVGREVQALQQALLDLGFDIGLVDGRYGYLTYDAVRQFQRTYRLRVDGVAGSEVQALLYSEMLPKTRLVYTVGSGERIMEISRRLGVSQKALRRMNRMSARGQVYDGQRLVVHCRYIMAGIDNMTNKGLVIQSLERHHEQLSTVTIPVWQTSDDDEAPADAFEDETWERLLEALDTPLMSSVAKTGVITNWDAKAGRYIPFRAAFPPWSEFLRRMEAMIVKAKKHRITEFILDVGGFRWGDGIRLSRIVRRLSQELRARGMAFSVALPPPITGPLVSLRMDIDYRTVGQFADRLHLRFQRGEGPLEMGGASTYAKIVRQMRQFVPPWKIVLAVPISGWERDGNDFTAMSYQAAITRAYKNKVRPRWDDERQMMSYIYTTEDDVEKRVFVACRRSLDDLLDLGERLNLAGLALWYIGWEDRRLWQAVAEKVKVLHLVGSDGHKGGEEDIR